VAPAAKTFRATQTLSQGPLALSYASFFVPFLPMLEIFPNLFYPFFTLFTLFPGFPLFAIFLFTSKTGLKFMVIRVDKPLEIPCDQNLLKVIFEIDRIDVVAKTCHSLRRKNNRNNG
jgi:hypothetical protein